MIRALAFVVLAACGGSAKPAAAPPSGRATTKCDAVADQLLSLMTTTAKDAPTERIDRMRRVFTERCEKDAWTADAQQCFLEVASLAQADEKCSSLLTQAQKDAFGAAIQSETEKGHAPVKTRSSDPCEGGE